MMNSKIKNSIIFFFTMMFTSILYAQDIEVDFYEWDSNNNELISRSEFNEHFTSTFETNWRLNEQGAVSGDDLYPATYQIWDVDGDQMLSEDEWLYGYDFNFGDYVLDDYNAVDTDKDGFVDYVEFYETMQETDYQAMYDVDGDNTISRYELSRAIFNSWDYDDSNFIEKDEFDRFKNYYLTNRTYLH